MRPSSSFAHVVMKRLILISLLTTATAEDRFYDFVATPVINDTLSPNCYSKRPMFLINGEFPGPTIEVEEGDMVHITLHNEHPSETLSIHFHGIHQKGTPYSDGVPSVTQCGLAPLQSQVLSFLADPSGTHFWHAHQSLLMSDGITGPFIVQESNRSRLPEYDEEIVIFLQDWYHTTGTDQRIGLDSEPFVWIGNPQSLLINGKGIAFDGCESNITDTRCLTTCNDTASLLSRINVEEGKTYRLRIINGAQLLPFNFAIAGHLLTIIEADGTLTDPVVVPNLDITPGQRYSVLLTANNPDSSPYWIRTVSRGREVVPQGWAILDYANDNSTLPANGTAPDQPAWDDEESGPALDALLVTEDVSFYEESAALEGNATHTFIMVGTQARQIVDNRLRWAINNISNMFEAEPLIVKARRTAQQDALAAVPDTLDVTETPPTVWNYTDIVNGPSGPGNYSEATMPLVLRLQKGDIVDLVMHNSRALNGVAEVHPWHMHGYSFWITGQGTGTFDPDNETLNLKNPVLRDTFTVWPLGWTAIRFQANNPGLWEFHCHITSHALMGMGLSIIDTAEEIPTPPAGATSCVDESLDLNDGEGGDSTSGGGDSTSGAANRYNDVATVLLIGGFVTTTLVVAWL